MDCDSVTWKSFSLTNVVYPEGDVVGKILAAASLSPFAILIALASVFYSRRDVGTLFFLTGLLSNEGLNRFLKTMVKSERPCLNSRVHFVKHGMPSAHCQFMAFFCVYALLFLFVRCNEWKGFYRKLERFVLGLVVVTSTILCSLSRTYLMYHTVEQVLVGILIGTIIGGIYYYLVYQFLIGLVRPVLKWSICRGLFLCDLSECQDSQCDQYELYQNKQKLH